MSAPVCDCVWCWEDRRKGLDQFRLRLRYDSDSGLLYYDPRPGAPLETTKERAPLVGPQHVARAPGLTSEPA